VAQDVAATDAVDVERKGSQSNALPDGFDYNQFATPPVGHASPRASTPEIVMADGVRDNAEVSAQHGAYVTSSQTDYWDVDDAMLRQLVAATKNTVIVDGHVEGSAAELRENQSGDGDVSQTPARTVQEINGDLTTLMMVSELSRVSKPADVPAAATACDRGTACPAQPRHFVVVAIDFGTALSGYAFAFVRDPCRAIHMMRRWDGGDPGVVNQKTPTTLLLDPVGRFHSFGYTARDFYHDLDEDEARQWLFFDKFKMTLHHADVIRTYSQL